MLPILILVLAAIGECDPLNATLVSKPLKKPVQIRFFLAYEFPFFRRSASEEASSKSCIVHYRSVILECNRCIQATEEASSNSFFFSA
jgi:hypothetical protein